MQSEALRKWTTESGLPAVALRIGYGLNTVSHFNIRQSWVNGYVGVPPGHPLHGVGYGDETEVLRSAFEQAKSGPVGKRGAITIMCASFIGCAPELVFDVHGSLTYSGNLTIGGEPISDWPDHWWFGFDTNHCDDTDACEEDYVASECERLARQIVEATS